MHDVVIGTRPVGAWICGLVMIMASAGQAAESSQSVAGDDKILPTSSETYAPHEGGAPHYWYPGYLGAYALNQGELNVSMVGSVSYGLTDYLEVGTWALMSAMGLFNITVKLSAPLWVRPSGPVGVAFTVHQLYEPKRGIIGGGLDGDGVIPESTQDPYYLESLLRPAITAPLSQYVFLTLEGLFHFRSFLSSPVPADTPAEHNVVLPHHVLPVMGISPLTPIRGSGAAAARAIYRYRTLGSSVVMGGDVLLSPDLAMRVVGVIPVATVSDHDATGPTTALQVGYAHQGDYQNNRLANFTRQPLLIVMARKSYLPGPVTFHGGVGMQYEGHQHLPKIMPVLSFTWTFFRRSS